jgi:nicotinate-nucleotide adenylyltransferase
MGGTFDPIHVGHLDVAHAARRAMQLDRVWLLPSHLPPHRGTPHASAADRMAMVELAVHHEPGLAVSDLEMHESHGPSYTSATLDRLHALGLKSTSIFFVTGADAFRDISTWKDYPVLLDWCHFVVVSRPGCPVRSLRRALPGLADRMVDQAAGLGPQALGGGPEAEDVHGERTTETSIFLVDAATAPVSSTDVRRHAASGESIEGLVPPAVADYIASHGLYR